MASSHLAHWVDRWVKFSRRVCLVGFSLGADVVWNAVRQVDKRHWPMIDIVLICGATPGNDDGRSLVRLRHLLFGRECLVFGETLP